MNYNKYRVSELRDEIDRLGLRLPEVGSGKNGRVVKKDLIMVLRTGKVGKSGTREVGKKPKLVFRRRSLVQRMKSLYLDTSPYHSPSVKVPVSKRKIQGSLKSSTDKFANLPAEILLKMVKDMKTKQVIRLCEVNKKFNQSICKNKYFWIQRFKKDFGVGFEKGKDPFRQYVDKYEKVEEEYRKYPKLEEEIKRFMFGKNSKGHLYIVEIGLEKWPEALKGKEKLIIGLNCNRNQLTSFPSLPSCETLICVGNKLTSLPSLPRCKMLICDGNKLTSLPSLPRCELLHCNRNQLKSLPPLLRCGELNCDRNQLTSLPPLPLCFFLVCRENQLTSLPPLPLCKDLYCDNNRLTSLPALPRVRYLEANFNRFTPEYVRSNPLLRNYVG